MPARDSGKSKRNKGAHVATVAVCDSDAAEAAWFQLDGSADAGPGNWSYVCGFQLDSGSAAYTAALPEPATTRSGSNRAHRWKEDG